MANRSITLTLRAQIDGFKKVMDEAAKAAKKPGEESEKSSKGADTALGRMVESAQKNGQAWQTAGRAATVFGATITAVGAAALKTGIQYNTLQQTTRASLTTMLGSARAAETQLGKLDDFARNSPFAKQTFIQAQQQMLAFGVETQKVIPYLDAVQNAVAAAGGGNQEIASIVETMSKIQAAAKITATDLMEFGNRGIDAATLIGSQMGMTGAEIRESITAGTLDATEALDALAAAMSDRFAGASDGVKDTFEGALDRIKAAWRDLSAELAAPLVDPEGGGLLVDWMNNLADSMRQFQDLPGPVKATVTALTGTAGLAALAGGSLLLGLPRYIAWKNSLAQLADISPRAAAGIRNVGGALRTIGGTAVAVAAVAAATGALVDALTRGESAPGANELERAIRGVANSGGDLAELDVALANTGTVLGMQKVQAESLTEAFDKLLSPDVTDRMSAFFGGILPGVTSYMETYEERIRGVDSALASMAQSGDPESVLAVQRALEGAGYSAEQINQLLPQTKDALIGLEDGASEAASGISELSGAIDEAREDYAEARDAFDSFLESVQSSASAFSSLDDSIAGNEYSFSGWKSALEQQATDLENWVDNLEILMERGASFDLLQRFIDEGPGAASALADLAAGSDKDLARVEENLDRTSEAKSRLDEMLEAGFGPPTEIEFVTNAADVLEEVERLSGAEATVVVDGDVGPVVSELEGVTALIDNAAGTVTILGEDGEALDTLTGFTQTVDSSTGTVTIQGRDSEGRATVATFRDWASAQSASLKIDADTRAAHAAIAALQRAARTQATMRVMGSAPVWTGGVVGYAGGGRVPGTPPADPRADNVAARTQHGTPYAIRSGEWIINEPQSRRNDHWLRWVNGGGNLDDLFGYASGGQVGHARRQVSDARAALAAARRRRSESAIEAAEKRLERAEQRLESLQRLYWDTLVDTRRGEITGRATSGLSGAYSVVDQLRQFSRNSDFTSSQRSTFAGAARQAEVAMERLYGQAERIESKLADAKDNLSELSRIQTSVASGLQGGFSLADALGGGRTSGARGAVSWSTSGGSPLASARAYLARLNTLNSKLDALRKRGLGGPLLQEIAGMGVEGGIAAADVLLSLSTADTRALASTWTGIETASMRVGQTVTEGFFKGGVAAAEGLVAGLESQQRAIEKQIEKVAKGMEAALKKALGIRSPSRVFRGLGQDTGEGMRLGILDKQDAIAKAASAIAHVPASVPMNVNPAPRAMSVTASLGDVVAQMSDESIQRLGDYIVAAADRTANGVVDGRDRALAGTRSTRGRAR